MSFNYVELTDINGTTWRSDTADEQWSADEHAQIAAVFSDFATLETLALEIDGAKHFFNPAHIVSVAIKGAS